MKRTTSLLFILSLFLSTISMAQTKAIKKTVQKQRGLAEFPELIFTDIPGAPKLDKPILITGTKDPVISEGLGIAAPAFWDLDGDGLKDLLIGEFGSGSEYGHPAGNFIRVYKNIGSETKPAFSGEFDYARPPFNYPGNGTPYSVSQFCCMGFTPQFTDLNEDGFSDLITGQYQGEVSWFLGSKEGFLPGETLLQEGNPRDTVRENFMKNQAYWLYSPASFGDFTADGLQDLIVGGKSLRISKNVGTRNVPSFAKRELLQDIDGNPLKVYDYTTSENKEMEEHLGVNEVPISGDEHLSPYVVDWDNDGTLDLLVTNSYEHPGLDVVNFFKGIKINGIYRFQKAVPLFRSKNGGKEFPGNAQRISVADWNNDGINDLLIGTSVITIRNELNGNLSWNWESQWGIQGISKYPVVFIGLSDEKLAANKRHTKLPPSITWTDYLTMRQQGYVYVMLGKK